MLESLAATLLILVLRSFDVSVGSIRVIFMIEGRRAMASALGFLEALLFIGAAGIVFSALDDPIRMVGYAGGFAVGQYAGLTIVRRLRLGMTTVRIISPTGPIGLATELREKGFTVTTFDGEGRDGPVRLILAVVPRRQLDDLLRAVKPWHDRCFVTVGDEPIDAPIYPSSAAVRK